MGENNDIQRLWKDKVFREYFLHVDQIASTAPVIAIDKIKIEKMLRKRIDGFHLKPLDSSHGKSLHVKLARNLRYKHADSPLSTEGNAYSEGRFHRIGVTNPTLYFAENEFVSLAERRISGLEAVSPHMSFWADIKLQNVLNLIIDTPVWFQDEEEKKFILSLPYRYFNDVLSLDSFTQILAKKARCEGYEAIAYSSLRSEGKMCLAVFADRLLSGSYISVLGKEDFNNISLDKLEILG